MESAPFVLALHYHIVGITCVDLRLWPLALHTYETLDSISERDI